MCDIRQLPLPLLIYSFYPIYYVSLNTDLEIPLMI